MLSKPLAFLCLLCLAFSAFGLADCAAGPDERSNRNQFSLSFLDTQFDATGLKLFGERAHTYLQPTPEGLRIALGETDPIDSVGFGPNFTIHGNFRITASFKIVELAKPDSGFGSGPEIYIGAEDKRTATIGRIQREDGRNAYKVHRSTPSGSKTNHSVRMFDTDDMEGKLQLERDGETLIYSVLDNQSNEFREIQRFRFSNSPVTTLRVGNTRGGSKSQLTTLWTDLSITELPESDEEHFFASFYFLLLFILLGFVSTALIVFFWKQKSYVKRVASYLLMAWPCLWHQNVNRETEAAPLPLSATKHAVRWWTVALIFLGILSAATGIRWYGAAARSLWFDEALSWKLQTFPVNLIVERATEPTLPHPPLYFIALHYWTHLVGDSELALRSLSILCSLASLVAVFFLTKALASFDGRKKDSAPVQFSGLMASALLAFSLLHIHASHQARGYTLAVFFLIVSSIYFIRLLDIHCASWSDCLMYSIFTVALCYTHNLGLFSVAAQWGFALIYLGLPVVMKFLQRVVPAQQETQGDLADRAYPIDETLVCDNVTSRFYQVRVKFVASVVLFVLLYGPWFFVVQRQSHQLQNSWARSFSLTHFVDEIATALFLTSSQLQINNFALASFAVLGLVMLWVVLCARDRWTGLFLTCMGLAPVVIICLYSVSAKRSIFDARYLVFAQTFWLVGLAWAVSRIRPALTRICVGILVASWFVESCVLNWNMIDRSHNPGMRGAIDYIHANMASDELILCETPFVFFSAQYYCREQNPVYLVNHDIDRFLVNGESQLLESDMITPKIVNDKQPAGIWLVTSRSYMTYAKNKLPANCIDHQTMRLLDADSKHFNQDLYWESPIKVHHFVKAPIEAQARLEY